MNTFDMTNLEKNVDTAEDMLVDRSNEGIVLITLHRPDARNALRNQSLCEIARILQHAEQDATARVVVITGGPTLFAAGADLKEMEKLSAIDTLQDARPTYWRQIAGFSKPLIGAVNGYAFGAGCELVMHMDMVIAGAGAKFGQPEINLGLMPGAGGTQRLVRTVGKPLAMKMVLSGEAIDADTALRAGLVTEVLANEEVLVRAMALAKTIAAKSPLAIKLAKEAILRSFDIGLTAGLDAERKSFSLLAASEDRKEGIAAFLEKRPAVFTGK